QRNFCDICVQHKKVFSSEQLVFYPSTLNKHYRVGNKQDFNGHPECKFCSIFFYDSDMLYIHCRKNHEQCFLCQKVPSKQHIYYQDYRSLVDHFETDHYPCRHPSCIEQKFVIFHSSIDLKAHEYEVHGKNLVGQKAKWEAKKLDIDLNIQSSSRNDRHNASSRNDRHNASSRNDRNNASSRNFDNNNNHASGSKSLPRLKSNNSSTSNLSSLNPIPASDNQSTSANPPSSSSSKKLPNSKIPVQNEQSSSKNSSSNEKKPQLQPNKKEIPGLHFSDPNSLDNAVSKKPADFGKLSQPSSSLGHNSPITNLKSHDDLHKLVLTLLSGSTLKLEEFRKLTKDLKFQKITPNAYVESLSDKLFSKESDLLNVIKSVSDLINNDSLTMALQIAVKNNKIKKNQFPALQPLTASITKIPTAKTVGGAKTWTIKPQAEVNSESFPALSKQASSSKNSTSIANNNNGKGTAANKAINSQSYVKKATVSQEVGQRGKKSNGISQDGQVNGKGAEWVKVPSKDTKKSKAEHFPSLREVVGLSTAQPSSSSGGAQGSSKGAMRGNMPANSSKKKQDGKKPMTLRLV
ncbi:E3 ubiquitin-protein ligase hel2, partial [Smittium culicis]